MQLFAAQNAGVDLYVSLKGRHVPARGILAWATGCGKTVAAIAAMQRVKASTVLIICPAVVRNHWRNQIERWAPHAAMQTGVIEWGKERVLSSAAKRAQREAAYSSLIQIVSYELAGEVAKYPWDMIILDEVHHLGNPISEQSITVRGISEANPQAHLLCLSATLIPSEVKQLWHILHLLHPNAWGKPTKTGDISWHFGERFCTIKRTGYGSNIEGVNESQLPELKRRLQRFTHQLTRAEIAHDLPPLDVSRLDLPSGPITTHATQWVDNLGPDNRKAVIFTHHIAAAEQIHREVRATRDHDGNLRSYYYCDGQTPFAQRERILEMMAQEDRSCLLVATSQSLMEGVRLGWADRVLIAEWQQSPGRVLQLLGRFQAVDVTHKPQIEILSTPDHESQANRLLQRVRDINQVLAGGPPADTLERVFKLEQRSEDEITRHLQLLLGAFNTDREQWEGEVAE